MFVGVGLEGTKSSIAKVSQNCCFCIDKHGWILIDWNYLVVSIHLRKKVALNWNSFASNKHI